MQGIGFQDLVRTRMDLDEKQVCYFFLLKEEGQNHATFLISPVMIVVFPLLTFYKLEFNLLFCCSKSNPS